MKRYYIYLLLHRLWLFPIYVGQTVAPNLRYQQHKEDRTKDTLWMDPWMLVIGVYDEKRKVDYYENMWVDRLLAWGFPLRNKMLTKPDTPYVPFFWLVPLVRVIWAGEFGIVK